MPAFVAFAAGTGILVALVVFFAYQTQRQLTPDPDGGGYIAGSRLSVRTLHLNIFLSQGLVVALLLGLLWVTGVPRGAIGIGGQEYSLLAQLAAGIGLGLALAMGNEGSVWVLERYEIGHSEDLRRSLAPRDPTGWVVLLVAVLPAVALAEELLFRAAVIGAIGAGFAIPGSLLVVLSALIFAIGHGIQGAGGVLVTGALGLVLGVAFLVSGSLLLVVTAHYVTNALEFLTHEVADSPLG